MSARSDAQRGFKASFEGAPPYIARAPGRVNLIGDHTDYNDGFVLPMAIDRDVVLTFRPRTDGKVVVRSTFYDDTAELDLDNIERDGEPGWRETVKGVAWVLRESGQQLTGWEGVLSGEVPQGAGLSSSAAVEMVVLRAFAAAAEAAWEPAEAARLGQRVENEWLGTRSGLTDALVVATAERDHALLIDCRSLKGDAVQLPGDVAIVVLDTGTRRGQVDAQLSERRRQCAEAAKAFGVDALRDVTVKQLTTDGARLNAVTLKRARHVVTENARTLAAAAELRAHDAVRLGVLMNESHASLRDDFEVSTDELDEMVGIAQQHDACWGARMSGPGFGGCAIALVRRESTNRFMDDVTKAYQSATGKQPTLYVCRAAPGASLEVTGESVLL